MDNILFTKILLTVITVFVIFMGVYSTIPKVRRKYQGRTVRLYIAIGGVIIVMLISVLTWYRTITI